MSDDALVPLTVIAATAAGLVGGVFFVFSTFVMQGLNRLRASESVRAMQAVNVTAVTPPFMALLFGTALLAAVLLVDAIVRWGEAGAGYQVAGAVLYGVPIALTGGYHVPRNNALATVDPDAPGTEAAWRRYATEWTRANHLRTAASAASCVMFILACRAV